mmetsp:Transcript_99807/g.310903  ORF Transcript_99807/g.310903 Transcript_99807/m.310903 type:complete len:156 (-) Transcript_99807:109-576(-)
MRLSLKMHGLLVHSMTRNICVAKKLHAQGPAASPRSGTSSRERGSGRSELEDCSQIFHDTTNMRQLGLLLDKESFSAVDVHDLAPHLSQKVRMGSIEQDGRAPLRVPGRRGLRRGGPRAVPREDAGAAAARRQPGWDESEGALDCHKLLVDRRWG